MLFKQIVSPGLAHFSYFVGSRGEAVVIDPRRDIDIYLDMANENNMRITTILETHRNEDYIIGSIELAQRTGARIFHGRAMDFGYGEPTSDGQELKVGNLILRTLDTPGHSPESISIVLVDLEVSEDPYMVFTGDTLFPGDTGRTDFLGPDMTGTMACKQYDAIMDKLTPLGDGVIIAPGHGAGSVCGSGISEHPLTTIGYERRTNRLLQLDRQGFIKVKSTERHHTPPYFKLMERYNKDGAPILGNLPHPLSLSIPEIKKKMEEGAQLLDTRAPEAFAGGHIKGSISIWRDMIPVLAGWVLDPEKDIIIIDDHSEHLDEVVRYLVRIGFDRIEGYLAGGFINWYRGAQEMEKFDLMSVWELENELKNDPFLVDVRDPESYEEGHIKGAISIYAGHIKDSLDQIPKDRHVVVYCNSGVKTSMAASILKAEGYPHVANVLGGFIAWQGAGHAIER